MSTTFTSLAETSPYVIWPGAVARTANGDRTTLAVVDLDPDLAIAEHQHENEQVGIVLKGSITMTIRGEAKKLLPGDMYVIPPNLRHSAQTHDDGATVIDVFAPVRADWESKERAEPSPGRWP